jgi:hypothetical protein
VRALFLVAIVEPSVSVTDKYFGTLGVLLLILLGAIAAFILPRCAGWLRARLSVRGATNPRDSRCSSCWQ